jgi:asparagine synthetase B (glutamine-hydrolysing)
LLRKRGPDSFKTLALKLPQKPSFTLLFAASVLSLRGNSHSQITVQPLECPETGNILLWNGEIFSSELFTVNDHENDGSKLFQVLNAKSEEVEEDRLFKTFESIGGPYAFVYYVRRTETIYFGRDRFGRRSLLVSANPTSFLTLCSVKVKNELEPSSDFQELKANGIYKAKLTGIKVEIFC